LNHYKTPLLNPILEEEEGLNMDGQSVLFFSITLQLTGSFSYKEKAG
jgi:hypothetical protein